ncbi:MAG TPA: TonB-dependent receptor [Candidatus Polarisedimenticolia bacterium]|nr:TonB-dependent receptor [Candidatus Polarisedimenticolia bacterium]
MTSRRRAPLAAAWIFALLIVPASLAQEPAPPEDGASAPAAEGADSQAAQEKKEKPAKPLVERVRVAGRLSDKPEEPARIPAHVTIFTREQILASGAATVQDFLAMHSDFVVFDEVGNGVQATADLRGFNTGSLATSALVMVDGVRFNEPDTDFASFVLVPLSEVERIEVIRGSSSALFGEGGLGGAINIVTRDGADASPLAAAISGGSFGTQDYRLSSGGVQGKLGYYGGFERRQSEGFRDNSDVRISWFQGGADYKLDDRQSLGVDLTAGSNHLNQPGALTAAELEQDRTQNPFNEHDFSATDLLMPSVHYSLRLDNGFSLTSRLSYRDADDEAFVGGRSGLGSNASVDRSQIAWTAQGAHEMQRGESRNQMIAGFEISRDGFDTDQARTDAEGTPLPSSDTSHSVSQADSTRRLVGVFLQDTWSFNARWSATAGIRLDEVRLESDGSQAFYDFPPPTFTPVFTQRATGGERDFSQLSPKLGMNFNPSRNDAFYAGYSRGFRAPTVIELFAFPIFFSNPDLQPVVSDDYEAGWDHRFEHGASLAVNGFWIDVRDEIFFVMTDPSSFTGSNLNLPRTRRRGAVVTLRSPLGRGVIGELSGTYTDATFRSEFADANIGNQVESGDRLPQIPRLKLSAGVTIPIRSSWSVGLQDIYVGSQVLTSDLANVAPELDPYNLLNARVSYGWDNWSVFAQIDNLLDSEYSTRGIYAFNFSSFAFDQFYTPAPGRNAYLGISWKL